MQTDACSRYLGELQDRVTRLRRRLRDKSPQQAPIERPNLVLLDRNSRFFDDISSQQTVKISPNVSDGSLFRSVFYNIQVKYQRNTILIRRVQSWESSCSSIVDAFPK